MSAAQLHREHAAPAGPSNRSFGFTVGGILAAIGIARWLIGSELGVFEIALVAIGSILVALAALAPGFLSIPNRLWMGLGTVLFAVVSPAVMLLVYVTTFLPIGLLLRLRRGDPLNARFDRSASSYWLDRNDVRTHRTAMDQQF